ncbi:PDZ domain-containing protein, partial [Arthrospira platensis SPKY1]|nr:PDZ domain-containing protein [Arthrospira platensis SPKY1]
TDSIVEVTVNGILEKLDPHSVYIPPSEMEEVAQQMRGDFVGIGVSFYMLRDTVAVIKPIDGGPSAKAGILPGDRILFADKKKLYGRNLPNDSLYTALKGTKGSDVVLTIFRKDTNKEM